MPISNCNHSWSEWQVIRINSDGSQEEQRYCKICYTSEYRTTYPGTVDVQSKTKEEKDNG